MNTEASPNIHNKHNDYKASKCSSRGYNIIRPHWPQDHIMIYAFGPAVNRSSSPPTRASVSRGSYSPPVDARAYAVSTKGLWRDAKGLSNGSERYDQFLTTELRSKGLRSYAPKGYGATLQRVNRDERVRAVNPGLAPSDPRPLAMVHHTGRSPGSPGRFDGRVLHHAPSAGQEYLPASPWGAGGGRRARHTLPHPARAVRLVGVPSLCRPVGNEAHH